MYQALYRKWRPRTFDDVAGQEHITEILKNQVASSHTSHAYLFVGARGTGKTTCAKLLARAINCENPQNGNPCNACPSCLGIESGEIMDVVELDAASNNGVDNVRALREEAIFSPVSVKKRVYIIDETHMLSQSAFNALLKILEEPPEHLVFILATTELQKVPATILSRCQRYSFRRIDQKTIAARLALVSEAESITLDGGAASLLARLADGSMRDALSLLDQCSGNGEISEKTICDAAGLAGSLRTEELLSAILSKNTSAALTIFDGLWDDGKSVDSILSELCDLLRDTLLYIVAPEASLLSGAYDEKTLKTFSSCGGSRLLLSMNTILSALDEIKNSRSPKVSGEICLITLCGEPEEKTNNVYIPEPEIIIRETEPEIITPDPAPIIPKAAPVIPEAAQIISDPTPPIIPNDSFIAEFHEALKKKLKIGSYNIITDPSLVSCELNGKDLIFGVTPFAKNIIGTAEVTEILKDTAANILGTAPVLRFTEYSPQSSPSSNKIDNLLKFGNVKQIN